MATIQAFILKAGIRASVEWADENPNMSDMPSGSSHWKIILRRGNKQLTTHFSQGPAISREPSAADVLDCLASDAAGAVNSPAFEDWCAEYGYDTDSRKAERTFKVVQAQTEKLRSLLGPELFEELLFKTDRM